MQVLLDAFPYLRPDDFDLNIIETFFETEIDRKFETEFKLIWDTCTAQNEVDLINNIKTIHQSYDSNDNQEPLIIPLYSESFINRINTQKIYKIAFDIEFGNDEHFNSVQRHFVKTLFTGNWISQNKRRTNPTLGSLSSLYSLLEQQNKLGLFHFVATLFKNTTPHSAKNNELVKIVANFNASKNLEQFQMDIENYIYKFNDPLITVNNIAENRILNNQPLALQIIFKPLFSDIYHDNVYQTPELNICQETLTESIATVLNENHFNETMNSVKDVLSDFTDTVDSLNNLVESLSKIDDILEKFSSILKVSLSFLGFASVIIDLLLNFYKKDEFSYIFNTKDFNFIWNGGSSETFFFGLIPGKKVGIESMELLAPKKIIEQKNENAYYYDGKKYSDINSIKNAQLLDILNGQYVYNDHQKIIYTLLDQKDLGNANNYTNLLVANSVDELKTNFVTYLQKYCKSQRSFYSPIIQKLDVNKLDIHDTIGGSPKQKIDNYLLRTKPVLLAQLPILDRNPQSIHFKQPIINNHEHTDDNSLSNYQLPYDSWSDGNINHNLDNNYIIINPNNINGFGFDPKDTLIKQFMSQFDVDSKTIYKDEINKTSCFSELSTNINEGIVYVAHDLFGQQKYFLNHNDAYEFTVYNVQKIYETILIQDQIFTSEQDFKCWLRHEIKEV